MFKSNYYKIYIECHLVESWSDWFEGLQISYEKDETGETEYTLLSGWLDQAALHGVLMKIRDLGIVLVSIQKEDIPQSNH